MVSPTAPGFPSVSWAPGPTVGLWPGGDRSVTRAADALVSASSVQHREQERVGVRPGVAEQVRDVRRALTRTALGSSGSEREVRGVTGTYKPPDVQPDTASL